MQDPDPQERMDFVRIHLYYELLKAKIIGQHSYISLRFGVNEILSLDCSFVSIRAIKLN